jgi:hypothetical protein
MVLESVKKLNEELKLVGSKGSVLELRTGRAGPENSNFPDGPGRARTELPKFRPGPARPGPFAVGRVVCRGLCLVLPFPSV